MGQPDITARATWSGERLVQVLNSQAFEQAVKEQEYIQTSQAFEKAKADLKKLGRKLKMARL
jgi:hypothetical protein